MLQSIRLAFGGRLAVVVSISLLVFLTAFGGWAMLLNSGLTTEAVGVGLVVGLAIAWAAGRTKTALAHAHGRYETLRQSADEAEQHAVEVFQTMIRFVEARDRYWVGHSDSVGRLAEQIGGKLGLPEDRCARLNLAGQLHDLGMLAVPVEMVANGGKIGLDAFRHVTEHSEISYQLLRPLASMQPILDGVRHHHERMNGTGYPGGLVGEDIPLDARILAVAESYDAMTHDRPHRGAMTGHQAMMELRRCTPAGYDLQCVEALAKALNIEVIETAAQKRTAVA